MVQRPQRKKEKSLTCVRPLVGLEVRTLGVDFLAASELAFMYPSLGVGGVVEPRVVLGGDGGERGCGHRGRGHLGW